MPQVTIREIARAAGVSVATISRVINHPDSVQPGTKEHVLAVMKENNYQPNWFARGLNLGRAGTIALIIPGLDSHRFVPLTAGVESIAMKKNHTVFLCNTHASADEERSYLSMVVSRKADGIICASPRLSSDEILSAVGPGCPLVTVGKRDPAAFPYQCFVNYEEGASRMIQHFAAMGHGEVALLLDRSPLSDNAQIVSGYRKGMRRFLPDAVPRVIEAADSVEGGFLAAQEMIQKNTLPGALIASSSGMALGVMKASQDSCISIPSRFALAALSDSPICSIVSPALTGLELPMRRLGMVAARMLFDLLEGNDGSAVPQEIILQPRLKIRRSCGNTKHIYELFG